MKTNVGYRFVDSVHQFSFVDSAHQFSKELMLLRVVPRWFRYASYSTQATTPITEILFDSSSLCEPSCKGIPYQQISIVAQNTIYLEFYTQRILRATSTSKSYDLIIISYKLKESKLFLPDRKIRQLRRLGFCG